MGVFNKIVTGGAIIVAALILDVKALFAQVTPSSGDTLATGNLMMPEDLTPANPALAKQIFQEALQRRGEVAKQATASLNSADITIVDAGKRTKTLSTIVTVGGAAVAGGASVKTAVDGLKEGNLGKALLGAGGAAATALGTGKALEEIEKRDVHQRVVTEGAANTALADYVRFEVNEGVIAFLLQPENAPGRLTESRANALQLLIDGAGGQFGTGVMGPGVTTMDEVKAAIATATITQTGNDVTISVLELGQQAIDQQQKSDATKKLEQGIKKEAGKMLERGLKGILRGRSSTDGKPEGIHDESSPRYAQADGVIGRALDIAISKGDGTVHLVADGDGFHGAIVAGRDGFTVVKPSEVRLTAAPSVSPDIAASRA